MVSARLAGGPTAILQAAQPETRHPFAPLTGTLPLGEGRYPLGGLPVCSQKGALFRSAILRSPQMSNVRVVAPPTASTRVRGIQKRGLSAHQRSQVLAGCTRLSPETFWPPKLQPFRRLQMLTSSCISTNAKPDWEQSIEFDRHLTSEVAEILRAEPDELVCPAVPQGCRRLPDSLASVGIGTRFQQEAGGQPD